MKKFVISNFILMAVFLTACSDDSSSSSSSSKEDVVSCKLTADVDGEKSPIMCWQAPKIYEKELKAFCTEATSKAKKGTLSDEACEASNYVRRCDTPKDPLSALYVYDMGFRLDCDDFLKVVENGYEDSDDEEEESSTKSLAYYNIPEQRCVQCNAGLTCKSDFNSALGERHPELDSAGVGRIMVEKCGAVAKTPVAICSDNDDDAPLMVYFYDQALKGKKCEELITFVPAKENPLGLDDDSVADDEGDPEADEDGDEPDAEEE